MQQGGYTAEIDDLVLLRPAQQQGQGQAQAQGPAAAGAAAQTAELGR